MHVLYAMAEPGPVYQIRLAMAQLGAMFTTEWIDPGPTAPGVSRLARGDLGASGVRLLMADGTQLSDPDAILFALSEGSALAPRSVVEAAQVVEWMIFERLTLCPAILRALAAVSETERDPSRGATEVDAAREEVAPALMRINTHLSGRRFVLGPRYTIADTALYGTLHLAEGAGIDVAHYPAIECWFANVRQTPGFIDLTDLLAAA